MPVFGCSSGFWAAAKAGAAGTGASESQAARPWKESNRHHGITAWNSLCGVQTVDMTRDEYIAMKEHLARTRGLLPV